MPKKRMVLICSYAASLFHQEIQGSRRNAHVIRFYVRLQNRCQRMIGEVTEHGGNCVQRVLIFRSPTLRPLA